MPPEIKATIEVEQPPPSTKGPLWVRFIVTNDTDSPVSVPNPDVGKPPPELKWTLSAETFRNAVLLSFGLLKLALQSATGEVLPEVHHNPWVTPFFLPPLELAPGESFDFRINVADHFAVGKAGKYHLAVEYGDHSLLTRAEAQLVIVN